MYNTPSSRRKVQIRSLMVLASLALIVPPVEAQVLHPTKITSSDPGALATPDVKIDPIYTHRVMGRSADRKLRAGLSVSKTMKRTEISESCPVDEFLYILKGRETFTSIDGTAIEVKAGDAIFIPKGWKGRWDTEGSEEFYVIYDPDNLLPEKNAE